MDSALRSEVRERIQRALPEIIQQEIRASVDRTLGPRRG
jgi:hypothetical protein